MIEWKKLKFEEQALFRSFLTTSNIHLSDYNFSYLWMWDSNFDYYFAIVDNFLCIKSGNKVYFPIGKGNPWALITQLLNDYQIDGIPEEKLNTMPNLSFKFEITEDAALFDYLYLFDTLLQMKGNKFQAKRNLIYQFEQNYEFNFKLVDEEVLPQIIEMQKKWFQEEKDGHYFLNLEHEALFRLFEKFKELPLIGGALIVDKQVIAYTLAEYMNNETLLVHAEKAFEEYKGAYQMLRFQFLKSIKPTTYINKQETLGIPDLTKAKQAYQPIKILKKFALKKIFD